SFASAGSRHQLRPLSALPPKADIASAPRNALVTSDRERRDRTRPGSRAPPKRDAELRMVVTLRQAFVRVPQAIPPFFKACTHKSAFCKRGSVNVGFAPKATEPDHRRAPSIHPRHEIRVMRTERWTTVTPKRQSRDRTGPRP